MLAEFINKISEIAVKAAAPHVITPAAEPSHIYFIQDKDGDLIRQDAEPKPRQHTAGCLDTIVELAKDGNGDVVVWYNRSKIVVMLDDTTRRDTVTMPLQLSKQITLLLGLEARGATFKQPEFIFWLRTNFKGCLTHCESLIDNLRSVKFDNGQVIESNVQHGKSSLGTKIRSEVSAIDRIPEYVVFNVPIFETGFSDLSFNVECALEPMADIAGFKLLPLPGQIEQAVSNAEVEIGFRLRVQLDGATVSIYHGSP